MPEGPSIVILKEETRRFLGKTIVQVDGNTTIEKERLLGQRIEALRSWGKHFLIAHLGRSNRRSFFCERVPGSLRVSARR